MPSGFGSEDRVIIEKKTPVRHTVLVEQRANAYITGVTDVISFDEETVICDTEKGLIIIRGVNLHVSKLNLDNGELNIDGEITGFNYEDNPAAAKGKSNIFGRIFK